MRVTKDKRNYAGRDLDSMSVATNYYNWIISEFDKYIDKNIAEVGAGSGTFTKYILNKKPKKIIAVEPSHEMFPLLEENMKDEKNVEIHHGFFEDKVKEVEGQLDTVFYINVMEHVEDDVNELKTVYKALRPGGYICIYVPAMQIIYGSFDEQVGHYRRYNKKDLKKKMEEVGFKVEKLHYSDMVGVLPWFINFKILKKKDLNSKQVAIYDRFIIPMIRMQESIFKSPFGKNIWAVGKKPN